MNNNLIRTKVVLGLVLILSLGLVACGPASAEGQSESEATTQTQTTATRVVRTVSAETGALSTRRSASVTVEPVKTAQIAARTSGQVALINVREGGVVAAGDTIITLDDADLQLQARNARIAVESAGVNLQKAQNATQEGVGQAQGGLDVARANLDLLQKQVTEAQQLFAAGGMSSTELAGLEAQLTGARSSFTQAQNGLASSNRATGEDIELLRLQLEQARTSLEQANRALANTKINAPFAGVVAEILSEQGEFLGAGSPAFELVSADQQLARFSVPPQDARRLLDEGEVYISYGGLDYAAYITRSSSLSGQSRLVEVTAELYPSENPIPTGAVAEVGYSLDLASGIRLPAGAIKTTAGQGYVFLLEEDKAIRQDVTVLSESGGQAVVSGIENGANVIFPIPSDLRSGLSVSQLAGER